MRSSYEQNNFGEVLYNIVTAFRPANAVELGVLDGCSSLHIAMALRDNIKRGVVAQLDSYDLFDDYQYKHGDKAEVEKMLKRENLDTIVNVYKADAFKVHASYQDNRIYFLHVDISNTGDIIRKIMELWHPKMVIGGLILFEGGSAERDKIEWMVKYKMAPIKPEIETNKIINDNYIYGTYLKFPSLTCLLKKR